MTFARRASGLIVGVALTSTLLFAPPAFAADSDEATMLLEGHLIQAILERGDGAERTSETIWSVATDAGLIAVTGDIPSDAAEFSGSVVIPDAVIAELSPEAAAAAEAGTPLAADSAAAAEVTEAVESLGLELELADASFVTNVAAAMGSYLGHSLYIAAVSFTNAALVYDDTKVTSLSATVRNYWLAQSEGAIPTFTPGPVSRYTSVYNCTTATVNQIWTEAAFKFSTDINFFFNGSGRHLALLVPQACDDHIGSGLGSLGDSVDEGGVLHVSIGNTADGPGLAHEIGHNLSLEHSNLTYCPSSCTEREYYDLYDIMGVSFADVVPLPALNSLSKYKLGFINASNVQTITLPGTSSSQTTQVVLKAINVRGVSGTRILRVVDPSTGVVTTLEYRSGASDDAGTVASTVGSYSFNGYMIKLAPGVRVLNESTATPGQSTQASWWNGTYAETSLQAGGSKVIGPMAVSVASIASGAATVNITLTRQTGTASISGNVKNSAAANLVGMCVDAVRGGVYYGSATTNASGNFTIANVQAGTGYTLHYSDCVVGSGDYEDRWFATGDTSAQATPFDISAGQTVTAKNITLLTAGPFDDVRNSHSFFTEIKWMYTSGISTGTTVGPDVFYYPANSVSRSAMAAFLYRSAGSPAFTPPASPSFLDVPNGAQFYKEIEWMKAEGISTGSSNGAGGFLYKPTDSVSRQSMSAFLYRLAGSPAFTPPATPSFTDVPTSAGFYLEVEWMKSTAITTGYAGPGGTLTYNPIATVNRAAMAAFLSRFASL